jgi:hypothetical protein
MHVRAEAAVGVLDGEVEPVGSTRFDLCAAATARTTACGTRAQT